jgi:hypothetical protein
MGTSPLNRQLSALAGFHSRILFVDDECSSSSADDLGAWDLFQGAQ